MGEGKTAGLPIESVAARGDFRDDSAISGTASTAMRTGPLHSELAARTRTSCHPDRRPGGSLKFARQWPCGVCSVEMGAAPRPPACACMLFKVQGSPPAASTRGMVVVVSSEGSSESSPRG